jgi:hypothetical protein
MIFNNLSLIPVKEIQFKIIFDDNLQLLDCKANSFGFCYLISTDKNEIRRFFAKLHNVIFKLSLKIVFKRTNSL